MLEKGRGDTLRPDPFFVGTVCGMMMFMSSIHGAGIRTGLLHPSFDGLAVFKAKASIDLQNPARPRAIRSKIAFFGCGTN
jgi:hypothetical protein